MRLKDEADYKKTIKFLEMEAKIDKENCTEMLNIEPSHLTKAKITAMGKLYSQYSKATKATIKKYKDTFNKKKGYERFSLTAEERTWYII